MYTYLYLYVGSTSRTYVRNYFVHQRACPCRWKGSVLQIGDSNGKPLGEVESK